jgi:hypothetical protein
MSLFKKIPYIGGNYNAKLRFVYEGVSIEKDSEVIIKQSFLTTIVTLYSDEMKSTTVANNIVYENHEYVLYYVYYKYPKSEFSKSNPIQLGTCRIPLDNLEELHGTYWTTLGKSGDISLKKNMNRV